MAERSIAVRLLAEVGNYVQGLGRAKAATGDLITELSKSEQQRQNFQQLGTGMLVAGAGIAAGIGLATKAAIDWETAWAGVVKTVDGSTEQLSALEDELRQMAKELPASHGEIAAVAEAAGQLGVKVDDVADFTRTMIDMGEATTLTAEEAAVSIAQMANVMGTAVDDVDRLGSAVVHLGNNSATNETAIVSMAQRIAGAGATIGLTEADVLGFSAALASVGINAEAGGSAISRAMISIETAVRGGGDELETLAEVAGMSADEFSRAYEQDAARAITTFIGGLGRMKASGEDVFAVLDELGFSEIRLRDALLRLASSGERLTESLDLGSEAWDANIALTEEAEKRYQTAASRIQIARNQLNDLAIEMGAVLLPAVASVADALGDFASFFGGLPAPIKNVTVIAAALTAAILLMGGTALMAVTRLAAYRAAMASLTAAGGTAATAVGGFNRGLRGTVAWGGRALGVIAALQLASLALGGAFGDELKPQLDALGVGLQRFARDGEVGGEAARLLGDDLGKLRQAISDLGAEGVGPTVGTAIAEAAEFIVPAAKNADDSLAKLRGRLESVDTALAQLVQSGHADDAAATFERIAEIAEEEGVSVERLTELFPAYAAALEVAAEQTGEGADAQGELAGAIDETTGAVEEQTFALQAFAEELLAQTDPMFKFIDAQRELEGAQDAVNEALNEHGENSPEYQQALRDEAEAALGVLAAAGALGDEFTGHLSKAQRQMLKDAGLSAAAVDQLERDLKAAKKEADRLDGTRVDVTVKTPGLTSAQRQMDSLLGKIRNIPRNVDVNVWISQHRAGGPRLQHGGEVFGPPGPDRVPVMATAGEFMIRRDVAQSNLAELRALNVTGRWPVAPTGGGGGGGGVGGSSPVPTYSSAQRYVFDFRGVPPGSEIERFTTMFREALRTNPAFRVDVRGT